MTDKNPARRARSRGRLATDAEQRRLIERLQRAVRLLQQSDNNRANPEDDDEDPTRRAGA